MQEAPWGSWGWEWGRPWPSVAPATASGGRSRGLKRPWRAEARHPLTALPRLADAPNGRPRDLRGASPCPSSAPRRVARGWAGQRPAPLPPPPRSHRPRRRGRPVDASAASGCLRPRGDAAGLLGEVLVAGTKTGSASGAG